MKKIITLLGFITFTVYSSYASGYSHAKPLIIYYADTDNDGYGDASNSINATNPPSGYVENSEDCNDIDASVNPGATEVCNEIDDNCDGSIDEGVLSTFYVDYDGDAYSNSHVTIVACIAPMGWGGDPGSGTDCNDTDPYATDPCPSEFCNGIDDNGNGLIDDNDPELTQVMIPWYADGDGDGYGDPETFVMAACSPPEGYLPWPNNGDCDDSNPAIHPGAQERCNDIDDDCDGLPDPEICNSIDTDCDGVPDNLDVCPGGDDSIDNNADGIADCSQLLNYNDYSPAWHCDNNKIYVCHNDNNPQTICIDFNALLPAHYNHGDWIGPCTSCPQNLIQPGNPEPSELAFQFMVAEQIDSELNASGNPFNNPVMHGNGGEVFFVMPNPADDYVEVQTTLTPGVISVMDISGKIVLRQVVSGDKTIINTGELMEGIYFLRIQNGVDCFVRGIVVMH